MASAPRRTLCRSNLIVSSLMCCRNIRSRWRNVSADLKINTYGFRQSLHSSLTFSIVLKSWSEPISSPLWDWRMEQAISRWKLSHGRRVQRTWGRKQEVVISAAGHRQRKRRNTSRILWLYGRFLRCEEAVGWLNLWVRTSRNSVKREGRWPNHLELVLLQVSSH